MLHNYLHGWAVAESLLNGNLLIGGDGSVKNGLGTHGYELRPVDGDSIRGAAQSLGTLQSMSSLRAEHLGEIAILLILCGTCTCYNITECPATKIHIDNKEVVDQGSKLMEKREKLQDYDLWAVSKSLRHSLPIEAKNTWVKAHQDDGDTPLAELPPAGAQINIAVDALAGGLQNSIQGTGPLPVPHYGPEQI